MGSFRADILCKDVISDTVVLIENQLERTDHTHLGQLLTYAAGLHADTIVWIAERFTDEHRAALDWLNENTPDNINFFGLEVELWRIGDSPLAPKFNVVCKPNEWTRSVAKATSDTEVSRLCWDYWSGVMKALEPFRILAPNAKPYRRKDTVIDVGWLNFTLKAYFSQVDKDGGVWVACRGAHGLENFYTLQRSKDQIEKASGHSMRWSEWESKDGGSFFLPLKGIDTDNASDWPRQHQLYAETLAALYRAVAPFVEELDRESAPNPTA